MRQNQGVNILTLRKVLITLGQILSYAVRHRYIDHNPLRDAERPKGKGKKKEQKRNIRILNPEEINALLDAVEDQKYRTLIRLAIFSGAHQGELLGLKWSDIDWDNNQLHIQRTFNNQAWYDVKTETSDRKIDIGPAMMTELKRWKIACPPNKLNLVFPNEAGGPINHSNLVRRYFIPALEKAKIEKNHMAFDEAHIRKPFDRAGGKHQIHSIPARTLKPQSDIERVCSLDETGQSGGSLQARKGHF